MQASQQRLLRLNVGFLLHQGAGTSQEFEFDFPEIQLADDLELEFLRGTLRFTRTSEGLYLEGQLASAIDQECVRCLTPLDLPLSVSLAELLNYPPSPGSDPIATVPETGIFNLAPLLREHFLLGVPSRPLCRPDCQGLCPECGANWNDETCDHPKVDIDPRLAALKSLLHES